MTVDRLIHLLVGSIFLFSFIKLTKIKIENRNIILWFLSMSIGTWMPDWDLFFGIGFHRSPITHSILPAVHSSLWSENKLACR
jgi:hypothetical protein